MQLVQYALFATGFYPLGLALRAALGTSLFHAVHWAIAAWVAWGVVLADVVAGHPNPASFMALCLTGCAGIAVLGARRPHVMAWNFVVLGLLAVMLLPLVELTFLGARSLDGVRIGFLAVTLAVGVINYLPTRFGVAASLLGLGCAGELIAIVAPAPLPRGGEEYLVRLCWLAAPWMALARWTDAKPIDDLDASWREFRDRWGVVWAQRVREQFNRSAVNAGWPVTLTWFGITMAGPTDAAARAVMQETLLALMQRFIRSDKSEPEA